MADNGFVFGAYTHCAWPAAAPSWGGKITVPDPSGRSFLFSLINATGRAARFSLRHQPSAVQLRPDGVFFGAHTQEAKGAMQAYANFILMYDARAANHRGCNCTLAISADSSYQPDDADAQCDETFLAEQQHFAAEEIEVYEL